MAPYNDLRPVQTHVHFSMRVSATRKFIKIYEKTLRNSHATVLSPIFGTPLVWFLPFLCMRKAATLILNSAKVLIDVSTAQSLIQAHMRETTVCPWNPHSTAHKDLSYKDFPYMTLTLKLSYRLPYKRTARHRISLESDTASHGFMRHWRDYVVKPTSVTDCEPGKVYWIPYTATYFTVNSFRRLSSYIHSE